MPEGPELHLTSLFINRVCKNRVFSGSVARNPIHKCDEIAWDEPEYSISAESKGKELMLHLFSPPDCPVSVINTQAQTTKTAGSSRKSTSIRFTFGMSGKFEFRPADDLLKHSHLTFFTKDNCKDKMALSFVDYRRFGRWVEDATWSNERGPCVIQEYDEFVKNVQDNLEHSAFNKPICEVMLNQKFFSGIGNYLRAEILYRCKIPPFDRANSVLQLCSQRGTDEETPTKVTNGNGRRKTDKKMVKSETLITKSETSYEISPTTNGTVVKEEIKESKYFTTMSNGIKTKDEPAKSHCEGKSEDFPAPQKLTPKAQELLLLCHKVALEVVELGSTKYTLSDMYSEDQKDGGKSFNDWLQCYYQPGMKNLADHNNRTMWFSGAPGLMTPKDQKSRSVKKQKASKSKNKQDTEEKSESKSQSKTVASKALSKKKESTGSTGNKLKDMKQDKSAQKEATRKKKGKGGKKVGEETAEQPKGRAKRSKKITETTVGVVVNGSKSKGSGSRKRTLEKQGIDVEVTVVKKVKAVKSVTRTRVTRSCKSQAK